MVKLVRASDPRLAVRLRVEVSLGSREEAGIWGTACPEYPFHPPTPSRKPARESCNNNHTYLSSNWYTRCRREGFACFISNPYSSSIKQVYYSHFTDEARKGKRHAKAKRLVNGELSSSFCSALWQKPRASLQNREKHMVEKL